MATQNSGNEIVVRGNVVDDVPAINFGGANGTPVANFRIASTERKFNRQTNEWFDGETMYYRVAVWRHEAENVVTSLRKGVEVVVEGKLKTDVYTPANGEPRVSLEIMDASVFVPLARQTVVIEKVRRNGNGAQQAQQPANGGQQQPSQPTNGQQHQTQQQQVAQATMPQQQPPQQAGPGAPPPVSHAASPAPAYAGAPVGF